MIYVGRKLGGCCTAASVAGPARCCHSPQPTVRAHAVYCNEPRRRSADGTLTPGNGPPSSLRPTDLLQKQYSERTPRPPNRRRNSCACSTKRTNVDVMPCYAADCKCLEATFKWNPENGNRRICVCLIQKWTRIPQFNLRSCSPCTLRKIVRSMPIFDFFYRATLCCRRVPVCLSVCLSQASIVPKRLNAGSHKQRHTIAQGF